MSTASVSRRRLAAAVVLVLSFVASSCGGSRSIWLVGSPADKRQLRILIEMLQAHSAQPLERFAAVREISSILLRQKEYGRLATFLTDIADRRPGDPYDAWYIFTAAWCYDSEGAEPIASLYYERVVKDYPDLEVEGKSIHYQSLLRLISTVQSPERRIAFFTTLITRFQNSVDMGRMLFLLGKEYEKVGDWSKAIETYARFLPLYSTPIPGYPDAYAYARNIVDFYNSPKDWAYEDLDVLVSQIERALDTGDTAMLAKLRAKVNFFSMSWHQDEGDANSQVLFDFAALMTGGRVAYANSLDPSSNTREAYLKTWGWSDRVGTWYLYFRKINFPADPEIHGRWEWAGIYFGEKMQ